MLPWECENCKHTEVSSPFETWLECPNCGSENFFHGDMIEDEDDYEEDED